MAVLRLPWRVEVEEERAASMACILVWARSFGVGGGGGVGGGAVDRGGGVDRVERATERAESISWRFFWAGDLGVGDVGVDGVAEFDAVRALVEASCFIFGALVDALLSIVGALVGDSGFIFGNLVSAFWDKKYSCFGWEGERFRNTWREEAKAPHHC